MYRINKPSDIMDACMRRALGRPSRGMLGGVQEERLLEL